MSDGDRFWSKVDRSGSPDACWLWQAGQNGQGYGAFFLLGTSRPAHRVSWIIAHGSISDDLLVCHDCPGGDHPLHPIPVKHCLWCGRQLTRRVRPKSIETPAALAKRNFCNTSCHSAASRGKPRGWVATDG